MQARATVGGVVVVSVLALSAIACGADAQPTGLSAVDASDKDSTAADAFGATDGSDAAEANGVSDAFDAGNDVASGVALEAAAPSGLPPSVVWQAHVGLTKGDVTVEGLTVDDVDNVTVLGSTAAALDLGAGPIDVGPSDAGSLLATFMASWDSSGRLRWSRGFGPSIGGPGIAVPLSHDSAGNVIAQLFAAPGVTVDVGDGPRALTSVSDTLLIKVSPTGATIFSLVLPECFAMAAEPDGGTRVFGELSGTRTLGSVTLTPPAGASSGQFVLSIDPSGKPRSAFVVDAIDGARIDGLQHSGFDATGALSTAMFKAPDTYLRTIDTAGVAHDRVVPSFYPYNLAVASSGDLLVFGGRSGPMTLWDSDPAMLSGDSVSRFDKGGATVWAVPLPLESWAAVSRADHGVAASRDGDLVVAQLEPPRVPSMVRTCVPNFVLSGVDRGGTLRWSHRFDDDACFPALGIGPTGDLYVGGRFGHSLSLGDGAPPMVHATSSSPDISSDMFIARLSPAMGRPAP